MVSRSEKGQLRNRNIQDSWEGIGYRIQFLNMNSFLLKKEKLDTSVTNSAFRTINVCVKVIQGLQE